VADQTVSILIQLQDRFTSTSRRITDAIDKLRKEVDGFADTGKTEIPKATEAVEDFGEEVEDTARKVDRQVPRWRRAFDEVGRSVNRLGRSIARQLPSWTRLFVRFGRSAGDAARRLGRGFRTLLRTFSSLGALVAAVIGIGAVAGILRTADAYVVLTNRITAFVGQGEKATAIQREIIAIAQRTRQPIDSVATVFQRLLIVQDDLRRSSAELLSFTEALTQAVVVSGASAQESGAALVQLSQGLASGTLRGDELRSVLEQLPFVGRVIADELGVSLGQLRGLGTQGLITSEIIFRAFENRAEGIRELFENTTPTIGQALNTIQNSFTVFTGRLLKETGAFDVIVGRLVEFSGFLDDLTNIVANLDSRLETDFDGDGIFKPTSSTVRDAVLAGLKGAALEAVPLIVQIFSGIPLTVAGGFIEGLVTAVPQLVAILDTVIRSVFKAVQSNIRAAIFGGVAEGINTEGLVAQVQDAGRTLREAGGGVIRDAIFGAFEGEGDQRRLINNGFVQIYDNIIAGARDLSSSIGTTVGSVPSDDVPPADEDSTFLERFQARLGITAERFRDVEKSGYGAVESLNAFVGSVNEGNQKTQGLIGGLQQVVTQLDEIGELGTAVGLTLGNAIGGFSDVLVDAIANSRDLGQALRQFFAQVLQQIASLIVQYIILATISAATGFPVGAVAAFNQGGRVERKAQGGRVRGYDSGGTVLGPPPPSPTVDNVPAMLQADEYVVRRKAAKHYGTSIMNAINSMLIPRDTLSRYGAASRSRSDLGFNLGGQVPTPAPSGASQREGVSTAVIAPTEASMERLVSGGRNALLAFMRDNSTDINAALGG
jgi:tape measure domain-containing protein